MNVKKSSFFQILFETITALKNAPNILKPGCHFISNTFTLSVEHQPIASVSRNTISLLGENIGNLIIPTLVIPTSKKVPVSRLNYFIKTITGSLIRINHIGICYLTPDIQQETEKFIQLVKKRRSIHVYEEDSEKVNEKWYFIGNVNDWERPLFEIVLKQSLRTYDLWTPHFQIDLDTNLPIQELESTIATHLGRNFIRWKLNIPDLGTVLVMGILGDVSGTKITLGLGTNKRNPKYLRTKLLKAIL